MSGFVPCPSCQRHVRLDGACPFCGGDLSGLAPPPPPVRIGGFGRAAIFALGATIGAAGCSTVPLYGAPAIDAGEEDAGTDASAPAPAYGAAPVDGG